MGDYALNSRDLAHKRNQKLAIQLVSNRAVKGYDTILHVEVDPLDLGKLQVTFERIEEPTSERKIPGRLAEIPRPDSAQVVAKGLKTASYHSGREYCQRMVRRCYDIRTRKTIR